MMELLPYLSAGGDVATIAIAVGFWRLDKRLSRLEWWRESVVGVLKNGE